MINLVLVLIAALVGACLTIFGLKDKNKLLNTINQNDKTVDEVKSIDSQIVTNNVTLNEEELKRGKLKTDDNSTPTSQQNLLDFFNNQGKK